MGVHADHMRSRVRDSLSPEWDSDSPVENERRVKRKLKNTSMFPYLNIIDDCEVDGNEVFPVLKLEAAPTYECGKSIINSFESFRIEQLDISSVHLTEKDMHVIIMILNYSPLNSLYLNDCQITGKMAKILAMGLAYSKLEYLYLAGNLIDDDGALEIATRIPYTSLVRVDLRNNHINEAGASAIANRLETLESQIIALDSNRIDDSSATIFPDRVSDSNYHSLAQLDENLSNYLKFKELQVESDEHESSTESVLEDFPQGLEDFSQGLEVESKRTVKRPNESLMDSLDFDKATIKPFE